MARSNNGQGSGRAISTPLINHGLRALLMPGFMPLIFMEEVA
jgi:hypothetical protein